MDEILLRLFEQRFRGPPARVEAVEGDGSPRRRLRFQASDGRTAIGVPPGRADEDRAFLGFTTALHRAGLPVPELYGFDESTGAHLIEDAGRESLFSTLEEARDATKETFPAALLEPFREAIRWLPRFQVEGGRVVPFDLAWPRADFDRRAMAWDLAWFKDCFLRLADVPFDEDRLEDDFEGLLTLLLQDRTSHFVYRDYQARNVMRTPTRLVFLDYQGGRRGSLLYDVASFLYSGSTAMPEAVREDLLAAYLDAVPRELDLGEDAFRARLPAFAVLRILQALGAYGYRGFHLRRPGFASRVGTAARNLERLLGEHRALADLGEIRRAVDAVLERPDLLAPGPAHRRGLTVHVGSFAYARGIPRAPGGHGGGFVFDCRALDNPGRDPRLAAHTGLDAPVDAALLASPAARAFLDHAQALVAAQVERYLERGFTSLDVRFGCTGGRHRSVWCTERLAAWLASRFPEVEVSTEHADLSTPSATTWTP